MDIENARNAQDPVELDAIVQKAKHYRLKSYAMKDELMAKINSAFLDGIEKFESKAARDAVEAEGLRFVHKHFPVEKIKLLEAHLMDALRDDLYYWSARVGREDIGIEGEFFVDHLIVIRIHYPHLVARKAKQKDVQPAPFPLTERSRLAMAALRNPEMLVYAGSRAFSKKVAELTSKKTHDYSAEKTHGDLATPARAHGAHVDTWYGHSYDGINLWLSIDGVNENNTVILYPDMFGQKVEFNPVSMYLAEGQHTPEPLKYAMEPGELLLLNPETLHGTQVNISDETRVALTTRINPYRPRFSQHAPFHFEYWYSSTDLEQKKWGKMSVFPHHKFQGKPSWSETQPYRHDNSTLVKVDATLGRDGEEVDVASSADLSDGQRLCLDLNDAKVMLWRDGDRIVAYSRLCPHMRVDLADGYHDGETTYCPGHGMGFNVSDGASPCDAFKLRQFHAYEDGGRIRLRRSLDD